LSSVNFCAVLDAGADRYHWVLVPRSARAEGCGMRESDVPEKPRPRWSIARTAGYSLLVVIAFLTVQTAVMVAVLVLQLAVDPTLNIRAWFAQAESNGFVLCLATFATTLLCVPLVKFLAGRREDEPWAFLRLVPVDARSILIWMGPMVAFILVSDLLTIAVGRPVVPEFMTGVYASVHPALLFVALVFSAPLFEEIFCRGFIIGALEASGV